MIKKQIMMIHGGRTFKNEKDYLKYLKSKKVSTKKRPYWEADLEEQLKKGFEIIRPRMPLQENAKYRDWKIVFEKYLPFLNEKFILIGSSLGGVFLAKYLSENKLPKKALSTYLVCPPFDNPAKDQDLVGGFALTSNSNLSLLEANSKNLYLMFSRDDDVVPVSHAEKYGNKLKKANIIIYKSKKGHFAVPKFPEIIKSIKRDTRLI